TQRQRHAQRVSRIQHATAATIAQHGRLEHAREQGDFWRRILRPAASNNQHTSCLAKNLRCSTHLVDVYFGWRRQRWCEDRGHWCTFAPDVDWAFDCRGTWAPVAHGLNCLRDLGGGLDRIADEGSVVDKAGHNSGLISYLV